MNNMYKIVKLTVHNVKNIVRAELDLRQPITVICGEIGSGKSALLSCFDLLRRSQWREFLSIISLLEETDCQYIRAGEQSMALEVELERDEGKRLWYRLSVSRDRVGDLSLHELLSDPDKDLLLANHVGTVAAVLDNSFKGSTRELWHVKNALDAIKPHTCDLGSYADIEERASKWIKQLWRMADAERERFFHMLHYGLPELNNLVLGGDGVFRIDFLNMKQPIPYASLSSAEREWLTLVCVTTFEAFNVGLWTFDDLDRPFGQNMIHALHGLLANLEAKVVLVAHSDHLLDEEWVQPGMVRACVVNPETRSMSLRSLDEETVTQWCSRFQLGLGGLRGAGYFKRVMRDEYKDTRGGRK